MPSVLAQHTHTVARWPHAHAHTHAHTQSLDGHSHTVARWPFLTANVTVPHTHKRKRLICTIPNSIMHATLSSPRTCHPFYSCCYHYNYYSYNYTHTHTHMHTFARWPYTHTHSRSMAIPDCKRDGHTHTPTSNHTHKHSTDTLTSDATHHMRIPQARRRTSQSLVGTQCHHCKCDGPAYAHTPTPHHLTPANGFDRTHTHILPTHTTHGVTATTHTLTHRYTHAPSHSLNCLPSAMQSKTTNHRSELRQSLLTGDSAFVAARSGFGQVTTTSTRSCAKHMDQGSVLNAIRHRGKKHHSRPPDPAPACVCCCKRAHMARHWLGVVKSARRCVHSFVELSCG